MIVNEESLIIVSSKCIDTIDKLNIPLTDKVELMINLKHFLDTKKYENNIKVLKIEQSKRRNK